jgi:hypothetical protein
MIVVVDDVVSIPRIRDGRRRNSASGGTANREAAIHEERYRTVVLPGSYVERPPTQFDLAIPRVPIIVPTAEDPPPPVDDDVVIVVPSAFDEFVGIRVRDDGGGKFSRVFGEDVVEDAQ